MHNAFVMLNMIESVNNSIESHDNSESQLSFTSSESIDGSPVPWNSNGTIHSTASIIKDAVSLITRLDDFNVIHIASGFFSTVFKVKL